MFARASLKSILKGEVKVSGEYKTDLFNGFVDLRETKSRKKVYKEGESGLIVLTNTIKITGRYPRRVTIKYNPLLYASGLVSGPTVIDHTDGEYQFIFNYTALADIDLKELSYLIRLNVERMQ